jgi:hypothetical protein
MQSQQFCDISQILCHAPVRSLTEDSIRMIAGTMLSWVRNPEVAWLCHDALSFGKVCRDTNITFIKYKSYSFCFK